jgi:membrane protein required for beta-lactamase induction
MLLIAILLCLVLQRFANIGDLFQITWFKIYLNYLSRRLIKLDDRLMILVIIVPVLLSLALLHLMLTWSFFGLFDLLLSVIILLFCIDARDLRRGLTAYFNALKQSDIHTASKEISNFIEGYMTENTTEIQRIVTRTILLRSFEQIFAGLFWFIVFGTYGIITYHLITLLRRHALSVNSNYDELEKLTTKIQSILEWLPSRLLGFTYALAGHFNKSFNYCVKHLWSSLEDTKKFTVESGLVALDVSANTTDSGCDENIAALEIIDRVLIIWLIAVVLITIGIIL